MEELYITSKTIVNIKSRKRYFLQIIKTQEGHYEKVLKKKAQFYFVNGFNPSEVPGAILVPETEAFKRKNKDLTNPFLIKYKLT